MRYRSLPAIVVLIPLGAVLGAQTGVETGVPTARTVRGGAEIGRPYSPPRTPWGDPDLQGVFSNDNETGTPLERPKEFEGRRLEDVTPAEMAEINRRRTEQFNQGVAGTEFAGGLRPPTHLIFDSFERNNSRAWLITNPPDGRVPPLTAEAQKRPRGPVRGVSSNANANAAFNGPEELGLYDRCITRGLPGSMMPAGYGATYEIGQGPGWVVIRYEMVREARVIPLDKRPHVASKIRMYMGDPRGWWEGDTLVVETTNFDEQTTPRGATEHFKMIERFKPISATVVDWSVTYDDPHTWTRPWTQSMYLTKKDQSQQIFEYACHEGNLGLPNILSGARAKEKAAQKQP
jgi:hypothetical protein